MSGTHDRAARPRRLSAADATAFAEEIDALHGELRRSLGARAVLIGRPWVYALAAAGQAGVEHVLSLIDAELRVARALTGCRSSAEGNASILVERR